MADEITYRQASDEDIERINAFYNKVYKKNRTRDQFNWEFNSAPAGKAIYIIAEYHGAVVGTQCAIPYYIVTHDNKEILSAKSEDTLVSPDLRGRSIFDNMYRLLIDACRERAIVFLWGFTYADKPFKKIGFSIPYKSTMGIVALKPGKAARYFYSITGDKSSSAYYKILGLTWFSYLKNLAPALGSGKNIELAFDTIALNTEHFNYLQHAQLFGLKLDEAFLDYRLHRNPYSAGYRCVYWKENGYLKASVHYHVTADGVGYIIHLHVNSGVSSHESKAFLRKAIAQSSLKDCSVIRFWGFTHNAQNKREVEVLKNARFLFLKRGISFVGLELGAAGQTDFSRFVLSRMASQGTD
jgi:N-acetylglutamate synthase-like GNAT family acetyltransferase